jgi:NAD dependent epimerase/dehydratase family enzyme
MGYQPIIRSIAMNRIRIAAFCVQATMVLDPESARLCAMLPLPAFAVRAALGKMGEAVLLSSQRVLPGALSQTAFRWSYPALGAALRHVLGRA